MRISVLVLLISSFILLFNSVLAQDAPPSPDVSKDNSILSPEEREARKKAALEFLRSKAEKYFVEADKIGTAKKSFTANLMICKVSNDSVSTAKGKLYIKKSGDVVRVLWVEYNEKEEIVNKVLLAGAYLQSYYPLENYAKSYNIKKNDVYTIQFPVATGFSKELLGSFYVIGVPEASGQGSDPKLDATDKNWHEHSPSNAESMEFMPKDNWLKGLVKTIKIWFDKDSFFLKQVEMKDIKGLRAIARLLDIKQADNLDDNIFNLRLRGVKIEKMNE